MIPFSICVQRFFLELLTVKKGSKDLDLQSNGTKGRSILSSFTREPDSMLQIAVGPIIEDPDVLPQTLTGINAIAEVCKKNLASLLLYIINFFSLRPQLNN